MDYSFEIPAQHSSIIKVMGVGGGGSNAVKHMFNMGIKDVEFVVCNTDAQALKSSPVPSKLQIGTQITEGLGAGANPEIGREAALESREEIRDLLNVNTKMLFITAGMGGGTGTGAAPVIAQISRELGILTVGIVTSPFLLEGPVKNKAARDGIAELKSNCDIVLIVANDKLRQVYGKLKLSEALSKADDVLSTAASSIAEIITKEGYVNVDFKDVNTVMKNAGTAVMGSFIADGEEKGIVAVEGALESPLLENRDISGARHILLNISYAEEPEMEMFDDILHLVGERSGNNANIIWGMGEDTALEGDQIKVTIIATGFDNEDESEVRYDLGSNKVNASQQTSLNQLGNKPKGNVRNEQEESSNHNSSTASRLQSRNQEDTSQYTNDRKEDSHQDGHISSSKFEVIDLNSSQPPRTDDRHSNQRQESRQHEQRGQGDGDMFDATRRRMEERSQESQSRLDRYKNKYNASNDSDENMMNVASYKRRGLRLNDLNHSSDDEVSRYTLNDDKDVLGNNSFLHDNVD